MDTIKVEIQKIVKYHFPNIKSEMDLLQLINDIHRLKYRSLYEILKQPIRPIRLGTLKYYKNIKLSGEHRYTTFTIRKKSGKERIISAPAKGLKLIQECLNEILQTYYAPNDYACGFVPNRNLTDGAIKHTNKPYVFNIDLKDFFDTITFPRVKKVLMLPPFNLDGEREPLAYIMASLCCHPKDVSYSETKVNCLPQGAPTSPILTNIVCRNLDRRLAGLAKRFHANYSRYADDITFSCHYNIFKDGSDFRKELCRIIEEDQGLKINNDKTRLQTTRQKQEVTGVIVNKKVNVNKRYVKQIRLWLHYWECFGLNRAQTYFSQQYIKQRGHVKSHSAHIENVLAGKLDYMRMVVGVANPAYKALKNRFDILWEKDFGNSNNSNKEKQSSSKSESINQENGRNYIANRDGISPIPKNQSADVPDDNLMTMIDGLIADLSTKPPKSS